MNLICIGVVTLALNTTGAAIFDLRTFPTWANGTNCSPWQHSGRVLPWQLFQRCWPTVNSPYKNSLSLLSWVAGKSKLHITVDIVLSKYYYRNFWGYKAIKNTYELFTLTFKAVSSVWSHASVLNYCLQCLVPQMGINTCCCPSGRLVVWPQHTVLAAVWVVWRHFHIVSIVCGVVQCRIHFRIICISVKESFALHRGI